MGCARVGILRFCLLRRTEMVVRCLGPDLPLREVVCQYFGEFYQTLGVQCLNGHADPSMQGAPSLMQEAPIGYVAGKGMLESVDQLRKEAGFVEKLGGLKARESVVQGILGQLGNGLQQTKGDLVANDRGGLQKVLFLRR
jgi:hypothetical protein